ncbi:MAG: TonB family protein, partial [Acidobacteriota bacterium]
ERIRYFQGGKETARWILESFAYMTESKMAPLEIPRGARTWPACDKTDGYPKLIKKSFPKYPKSAVWDKESGWVSLRVQIGPQGRIIHEKIQDSSNKVFNKVSLETAHKWRYQVLPCQQAKAPLTWFITFRFSAN